MNKAATWKIGAIVMALTALGLSIITIKEESRFSTPAYESFCSAEKIAEFGTISAVVCNDINTLNSLERERKSLSRKLALAVLQNNDASTKTAELEYFTQARSWSVLIQYTISEVNSINSEVAESMSTNKLVEKEEVFEWKRQLLIYLYVKARQNEEELKSLQILYLNRLYHEDNVPSASNPLLEASAHTGLLIFSPRRMSG